MIIINEDQLISAVKQIFAEKKNKYIRVEETKQLLLAGGLTQKEAAKAISLAEANEVIRWSMPFTGEIDGEPCYQLLTDKDREINKWLAEESPKEQQPQKKPKKEKRERVNDDN
jgi:hypothetical protein